MKTKSKDKFDWDCEIVPHSPGDWIVCKNDNEPYILYIEQDGEGANVDGEPAIIGTIDLTGQGVDMPTGYANARLCAASPRLLSSLKELLDWMRCHVSPTQPNSPHEAMVKAYNLIERIKGETALPRNYSQ